MAHAEWVKEQLQIAVDKMVSGKSIFHSNEAAKKMMAQRKSKLRGQ